MRSFLTLPPILGLTIASLLAAGCTEEAPAEEAFSTETLKGQDLVSCWSSKDPQSSSTTNIVCRLVGDGPLQIKSASVRDSGGWGQTLTPEEPERIVHASNSISNKTMTVKVEVDASAVAGLESFVHEAEIKFKSNTDHPAEEPIVVEAPFATWRVALIGEEAALKGAELEPYTIKIGSREVDVKPTFPDVAIGERIVVYLPVQSDQGIDGTGHFVADDLDEERKLTVKGSGAYLVRKDGLEKKWSPEGELPAVASCWVGETNMLTCQAAEAGGLPILTYEVTAKLANGEVHGFMAVPEYTRDNTQVFDNGAGTIKDLPGVAPTVELLQLTPESFPVTLTISGRAGGTKDGVRVGGDGIVAGFGVEDPFIDDAVSASVVLASANDAPPEAPFSATLPVQIWQVEIEATAGSKIFVPELEPYVVRLGTPWKDLEVGHELTVSGTLPAVDAQGTPKQTFFLAVEPGRTDPIVGTLKFSDGLRFAIPGPGRYVMSNDGLTAAPTP